MPTKKKTNFSGSNSILRLKQRLLILHLPCYLQYITVSSLFFPSTKPDDDDPPFANEMRSELARRRTRINWALHTKTTVGKAK